MLIRILHTGLKAVLIVDVGLKSNAVYRSHFTRLGCQSSSQAREEAAFLFGKNQTGHVVQLSNIAALIRCHSVNQNELLVRIFLCQSTDACKLEARSHDDIVVSDDVCHSLYGCCCITGRLNDIGHRVDVAARINEVQHAFIAVLHEGPVVHTARAGHEHNLHALCRSRRTCCRSRSRTRSRRTCARSAGRYGRAGASGQTEHHRAGH